MENHKHYELARRAHYNVSFRPEKRAEDYCASFDATIAELQALGIEQYKIDKYEALFVAHLHAKSRCISSMITGPARFPTARAEKANNSEHAHSMECLAYYNKIVAEAKQEAYYLKHPEARPILSSDENAVERLQAKLEQLQSLQKTMVEANRLVRKGDKEALKTLLPDIDVETLFKPDFCGRVGFADYQLTNNNAKIKATKQRIEELSKRKKTTPKDITINGVRCLENTEAMRLQLFFDGKPAPEIIRLLKSHAFKWSPSNMAWQRQLTNNAIYSFNHFILPALRSA